jgi:hypothetical protein
LIDDTPLNTLLFADDQIIFAITEDDLQRATFMLNKTANKYNFKISTTKTKVLGFIGKNHLREK